MSLMGVDVGTTGVKAVVFSESGVQLSSAYEEYFLQFPFPGAVELDSKTVVEAALRVIGKAASEVKSNDPVKAIGFASQGEAFVPVTADGEFLGNIMTSSDTRAEPIVKAWSEKFGAERLYQITGHTPYPMFSVYKMLWVKENQPEVWKKASKFLFCEDLIAYVLTGEAGTDYSLAARSMLFDVREKNWSQPILDEIGLPMEKLPKALPSGGVVGTIKPEMAAQLGLDTDVQVCVSGHDQPVGALGCGAASPGRASYAIGTVECICASTSEPIFSNELMQGNLCMYPHTLSENYATLAYNLTGGSVLRWLRDNIATQEVIEAERDGVDPYDRIVAAAQSEPANLVLIPQFGPTGTPHFDPYGTGVLFGLNLSTTRAEVLRAFLEGITYEMKANLSLLENAGFKLSELRVVGGGSKSATWMQIKADVIGVPLVTLKVTEGTCMGAAILAGGGTGILDPKKTSEDWATPVRTFEPRPKYASMYDERFEIYKEIYNSLGAARRLLHLQKRKGN